MGEVVCNDTAYLGNGGEERGYIWSWASEVGRCEMEKLAECKFKHIATHT